MKARDNPFAIDRIEALIDFDPSWCDCDWPSLFHRWQELSYRATVIGPHGSGKTTFLRSLTQRLQSGEMDGASRRVSHFFLNDRTPRLLAADWQRLDRTLADGHCIFLDGSERLSFPAWQRFHRAVTRANGRALVTRHQDFRFPALPKFLKWAEKNSSHWPILLKTRSSPALLQHLIEKLTPDDSSRTSSRRDSAIPPLFARHRGNLRDALWECYDSECL